MSSSIYDRVPPQNLEAERAVIGSCLMDKDVLIQISEILSPEDFRDKNYQVAFDVLTDMVHQDRPVDSLTFLEELSRRGLSESLGGQAFIVAVMDSVPTAANAEYHARIVRDKAVLRRLISTGTSIARMGYSEDREIDELLEEAERAIFEVSRHRNESNFKKVADVIGPTFHQIEEQFYRSEQTVTGVMTGFDDLDRLTGGLQPGSLNILAARPSMGKTALALNLARNVAVKSNLPVLVFSLEMGADQLVQRLLGSEARVNIQDLRTGNFAREDWEKLTTAAGRLTKAPMYIDDSSMLTTTEMRARCRRFKAQHASLGLIVVDYLQLMSMSRKIESKQQEVAEISRGLKAIARELEVPVLSLSQLSRAVESRNDKRPQLSDLRDSGAIEQDADLVALLYREAYYAKDVPQDQQDDSAILDIAKHRNGPTGVVHLMFMKQHTRFESKSSIDGF
ncbi:replicative DNA helicase [Dethiosulfovibrio sp. F2B]|uniref:replicative DNA helicase n=1 Tax=Dethiosulfovibrio faecalis TaxID=2720018 RepID=UPI001F486B85|nr:replicative DNA helicase [Dethiosulfovibrio faecalis]